MQPLNAPRTQAPPSQSWVGQWFDGIAQEVSSWFADDSPEQALKQRDRVRVSVAQNSLPAVRVPLQFQAAPVSQTPLTPAAIQRFSALNNASVKIAPPAQWSRYFPQGHRPQSWTRSLSPTSESLNQLKEQGRFNAPLQQALNQLFEAPLAPAFAQQREAVMQSILQDLAFPQNISQGSKDSCVSTVAQMKMAQERPVAYVQLMQELLSPSGRAHSIPPIQSAQGPIYFEREASALPADHSGRSLSERLFQASAMEYANAELHYHNASDLHSYKDSAHAKPVQSGLYDTQNRNLISALFGQVYDSYKLSQGDSTQLLVEQAQQSLQAGQSVSVGLKWLDGGHQVLLTALNADYAVIQNPQLVHQQVKMPRAQFEQALTAVLTPRVPPHTAAAAHAPKPDAVPTLAPELYLNIHDYLWSHPQGRFDALPEDLLATISLAFASVGLNGSHLQDFESALLEQPKRFEGKVLEQLDSLRSAAQRQSLSRLEAGQQMLAVLRAAL